VTRFASVERELQRARAARRALLFVALAAAGAVLLVGVATGSARAAAGMLVPGAALAVFVAALGVPRCPRCGGSLFRRGERPGSAGRPRQVEVERTRRCPRCGAALD
jgi:rubredoxin